MNHPVSNYPGDAADLAVVVPSSRFGERGAEAIEQTLLDVLVAAGSGYRLSELEEVEAFGAEALEALVAIGVADVDTFEDAGVLTNNRGLVLRCDDGSEFQITIVRSR